MSFARTLIALIFNIKTLIVATLSVASTYLCYYYDILAEFPLSLIGTAVVFPIVFSIGGAYKRREATLDDYGNIKAHGRALYFATRDWIENSTPDLRQEVQEVLGELLRACRTLFSEPVSAMPKNEAAVYETFSKLSLFVKSLRAAGLPSGEASRCNQFVSKMVISFENIKHVYQYRTPRTLRAHSKVFLLLLPVLYGPYFAYIFVQWPGAEIALLYPMPILFTVILTSLDSIQDHLENPFDQEGEDDVAINAEKFVLSLSQAPQS